MEADPELSDLKMVSEPWDCGGLYRMADFPARRVASWNGRFRDDLRRFWKGDDRSVWPLGQRLSGNPDLFGRTLQVSISGFADEIAAAASLVMGQGDEAQPVVLVRGLTWSTANNPASELVRPAAEDMFR